jgi:hypothetical protein
LINGASPVRPNAVRRRAVLRSDGRELASNVDPGRLADRRKTRADLAASPRWRTEDGGVAARR